MSAPVSREALDFAHIEKRLPDWAGQPYGYISTVTDLNRTRVKKAIRWAIQSRDDIVIVGPTSAPADNIVNIVNRPTSRSLKYIRWNMRYSLTRIRNRIEAALRQHAACEPDATDKAIMENLAADAKAAADQLERNLRLMEILIAKGGSKSPSGTAV